MLRGAFQPLKRGAQLSLALLDANSARVLSAARRRLRPEAYAAPAAPGVYLARHRAYGADGCIRLVKLP